MFLRKVVTSLHNIAMLAFELVSGCLLAQLANDPANPRVTVIFLALGHGILDQGHEFALHVLAVVVDGFDFSAVSAFGPAQELAKHALAMVLKMYCTVLAALLSYSW